MKKRRFYVEVDQCSVDTYWYADCIGDIFLVENDSDSGNKYITVSGSSWIKKKDCHKVCIESWYDKNG